MFMVGFINFNKDLVAIMDTPTGMTTFITQLETELTSGKLWTELSNAAPFIGLMVVFAFGYYIVRKVIKGVAKGKARV